MDRRYFIGLAGLGSVIGVGGLLASKSSVGQKSGDKALGVGGSSAPSIVEIALKATEAEVPLKRGQPTQVWQFQGSGGFTGSPAVADGKLVIASDRGVVYCFGSKPK